MLSPKNWKYRVALWMAVFFALLAWVLIGQAQDRIKIFELHKEILETFVGCIKKEDAVEIVIALGKGDETVGILKFQSGVCRMVQWPVTYKELIHSEIGPAGEHITVYRGQVNKKDIFVPMIGWTHQVI